MKVPAAIWIRRTSRAWMIEWMIALPTRAWGPLSKTRPKEHTPRKKMHMQPENHITGFLERTPRLPFQVVFGFNVSMEDKHFGPVEGHGLSWPNTERLGPLFGTTPWGPDSARAFGRRTRRRRPRQLRPGPGDPHRGSLVRSLRRPLNHTMAPQTVRQTTNAATHVPLQGASSGWV